MSGWLIFLRDLRVAVHVKLVKMLGSLRIGAGIDKGKAQFLRVS